jgi:amino acid transporter
MGIKPIKKISLYLLVLLIVSAIDSIRNLPSSALFGSSLIFFFVFSAVIFLLPISLVSAELAAMLPDRGGPYYWVSRAFNDKMGMLAIWLQWINTMVWYPTILSFIAGTIAYLINPALVTERSYVIPTILVIFWLLTFVNLFGIKVSARINSFCGLIGTLVPMCFLIILGVIWIAKGNVVRISFGANDIFPTLSKSENWISLTTIMGSFLGFELAGVHVNDIKNPQTNFPKAIAYSALLLTATMLFGSLAIAVVLPLNEINLISGVMQVFTNLFSAFHLKWVIPIIAFLIIVGSLGSIINWLISPAKGLLHAAQYGFLPKLFTKTNRHGVAHHILIAQAIVVSLFCLTYFLVPSVNAFYWFLTALSTDLYLWMYILMFVSALKLHHTFKDRPASFKIPFKNIGIWTTCLVGIFGCLITIAVSFFVPDSFTISKSYYAFLIAVGNITMIVPVTFFYLYRSKKRRPPVAS